MSVHSLSNFMESVQQFRENWPSPDHKELWFRGESYAYQAKGTFLHPVLYRPTKNRRPIYDLLRQKVTLYDDFQRCAVQISDRLAEGEDWDWDAYFLMRQHSAPTRLLDWSDGALIALHFAIQRRETDDQVDAVVYVLEPDELKKRLSVLPAAAENRDACKRYAADHKHHDLDPYDDAMSYLPAEDDDDRLELPLPIPPMVLDFPHITRRVAAQRSRYLVFGSDPEWLTDRFDKSDSFPLRAITIDGNCKKKIRLQLRDSGVTESVIFPDLDGLGREMLHLFWDWRDQITVAP